MAAPDALLADALRRDPAGPLLTYYDDSTGERTELSATTLANWVAKTANLLVDDADVTPGDRVAVLLPAHWQTAAVLLAVWSTGAVATDDPAGATVAFTDAERVPAAVMAGVPEVFALSLAPLGRAFDGAAPDGARDYAAEVRAHGDRFAGPAAMDTAAALDTVDGTATGGDVVEVARRRAEEVGVSGHDRVLTVRQWTGPVDWVDGLLVPLAAGASVVIAAHADPEMLRARVEAEQVTATLGITLPGVRPL